MGTNGSFYQNGLPISTLETGLGNVPTGAPIANKASSSFYLSGTAYTEADPTLAAASASAAAASAAAAAASAASFALYALTTYVDAADALKANKTYVDAADSVLTAAVALKAPLASPALTGVPVAPTATAGTNTTQLATTAFVDAARVILAAADALKAPLASPALTGSPTAPTATALDNSTKLATTAYVDTADGLKLAKASNLSDVANTATSRTNLGVPAANLLINGDFRVNQTSYASAAALASGIYGHDQWKAGAGGGDYSFTQLKSSTQITIAASKTLIQPIEDANVIGGSYVLSWTGTAQARAGVNTLTPSGSYTSSPLLITGQTAGTAMSVEFNSGTLGAVKLEVGASPTPFVMRPFDQELLLCKRYFYNGVPPVRGIATAPTTAGRLGSLHPVAMRAAPSLSMTANLPIYDGLTPTTITSIGGNASTTTTLEFDGAGAAGLTTGRPAVVYQGAGGNLNVDARL